MLDATESRLFQDIRTAIAVIFSDVIQYLERCAACISI